MVLMRGVWEAQPPIRYGVPRHYTYESHVLNCNYYVYLYDDHVTISFSPHASSADCC